MAKDKRWVTHRPKHGIRVVESQSWGYFDDLIREQWLDYRQYVWRGQRSSAWQLQLNLDRVTRDLDRDVRSKRRGATSLQLPICFAGPSRYRCTF